MSFRNWICLKFPIIKIGNKRSEILFSNDLNPFENESLFQNIIISNKIGDAIHRIKINAFLLNFNLLAKSKLKTPKMIISKEHCFLKIIDAAITHKKT
jgi:hypothetical protein